MIILALVGRDSSTSTEISSSIDFSRQFRTALAIIFLESGGLVSFLKLRKLGTLKLSSSFFRQIQLSYIPNHQTTSQFFESTARRQKRILQATWCRIRFRKWSKSWQYRYSSCTWSAEWGLARSPEGSLRSRKLGGGFWGCRASHTKSHYQRQYAAYKPFLAVLWGFQARIFEFGSAVCWRWWWISTDDSQMWPRWQAHAWNTLRRRRGRQQRRLGFRGRICCCRGGRRLVIPTTSTSYCWQAKYAPRPSQSWDSSGAPDSSWWMPFSFQAGVQTRNSQ